MSPHPGLLYLSGHLPARSETFVYREVFGLRAREWPVAVASVHPPDRNLGDARLDALADEVIPIYGTGAGRVVVDALQAALRHPLRAARTLATGAFDALTAGDVPITRRPKVGWQCVAGLALAHRARDRRIDHVHAHMAHVPATIGMYAARQLGVTFSMTGHAVDLFRDRTLLTRKLKRTTFVACISTWHRAFYRGIHDAADAHYPVVRCGVDLEVFSPGDRNGAVSLLAVGRLVPKKGFDVLLRAIALLAKAGHAVSVDVIGEGPQRDELIALAETLDIADRVRLCGAMDNDEVRRRMQVATIVALPCRVDPDGDRDGIPVVLMEAMACGACVVSGDLPAIRELVIDGDTGVLVPPGDADALAAALERLTIDGDLRDRLATRARVHVQAEFASSVNLGRIERALETTMRLLMAL